jgi:hypothetical protein
LEELHSIGYFAILDMAIYHSVNPSSKAQKEERMTKCNGDETTPTLLSEHEEDLRRLASFRLMDDDFLSEVLDGKIEAIEFIIQTILGRYDIKVKSTKAQVEYKNATKRSIKLDIIAQDTQNKVMNLEIQRKDKGTGVRRARFHSSMIDRKLLKKRDKFESLVDTYVIFITENDKFKAGLPIYHIERKITELDNALFGDGSHILYVNGQFQDLEHPIGRLMHDFACTDPNQILHPVLAEEVRYYKETEEGKFHMCALMEKMRNETALKAKAEGKAEGLAEGELRAIQNLMKTMSMSAEQAMEALLIPPSEMSNYNNLLNC